MPHDEDDNWEELLEEFTSPEAVQAANRERERWEDLQAEVDTGLQVKDYPKSQDSLDLHGFTVPEALDKIEFFIESAIQRRLRTVTLVTGKGIHSKNLIAVLPGETEKKLLELKDRKKVLAFKQARDGGFFTVYLIS